MSRARDIADFNASLFADDEISGDKVSGGTIGAGTFNGTIGDSATLPTKVTDRTDFYYLIAPDIDPKKYGNYYSTPDRGNGNTEIVVSSAVVPAGFSSVVDAYVWWISSGYTGNIEVQLGWSLSANSEAQGAEAQGYTSLSPIISANNDYMHKQNILDLGSTHWEDTIAQGDILGLRCRNTQSGATIRFLGISITWRF